MFTIEAHKISDNQDGADLLTDCSFAIHGKEHLMLVSEDKAVLDLLTALLVGQKRPSRGDLFVLGATPQRQHLLQTGLVTLSDAELGWASDLTIEDYLSLAVYLQREPLRSKQGAIFQILKEYSLDPDQYVGSLSSQERFCLSCIKSFVLDSALVIIREPLIESYVELHLWLKHFLQKLRQKGVPVVYLAHQLAPEFQMSMDQLMVLMRGKSVGSGRPQELLHNELGGRVLQLRCSLDERLYLVNRIKEKKFSFFIDQNSIFVYRLRPTEGWEVIKEFGVTEYEFSSPKFEHLFVKWRNELGEC